MQYECIRIFTECGLIDIKTDYTHSGRIPFIPWHCPKISGFRGRAFSDNILCVGKKLIKDMFKEIFKQVLAFFDYELRRRSRYFVDAFQDQKNLLQQHDVKYIFDCGANIGQTTARYRQLFPNATIYSFEPTEKTFNILYETFKNNDFVKPQQLAVSNINGNQQFFVYEDSQLNSLSAIDAPSDTYMSSSMESVEYTKVSSITLDEFCVRDKIGRVDILKMDIQGGELLALQGAVNLLQKQAIDLIYLEVNFRKLYEHQAYFYEINKFLQENKYTLYGVYNLTRLSDGTLGYGDAIFISDDLTNKLPSFLK